VARLEVEVVLDEKKSDFFGSAYNLRNTFSYIIVEAWKTGVTIAAIFKWEIAFQKKLSILCNKRLFSSF